MLLYCLAEERLYFYFLLFEKGAVQVFQNPARLSCSEIKKKKNLPIRRKESWAIVLLLAPGDSWLHIILYQWVQLKTHLVLVKSGKKYLFHKDKIVTARILISGVKGDVGKNYLSSSLSWGRAAAGAHRGSGQREWSPALCSAPPRTLRHATFLNWH